MRTEALFPDAPAVIDEAGRLYVPVRWDEADAVRATLWKRGCLTTVCLNPETREARLELWPGTTPEAVLAVLEARRPNRRGAAADAPLPAARERDRASTPATAEPAELICV